MMASSDSRRDTRRNSGNGLHWLGLAARGLKRDLRAADVRALFVALALAVAASTMIGFFLDRLERGLTRQAGQMLGGDLVLEQGEPFSSELKSTLREAGMTLSDQVDLVSMVSQGMAGSSGPDTRSTSAPCAASVRPATGPAMTRERSSTRRPASGRSPFGHGFGGASPIFSIEISGSPASACACGSADHSS